MKERKKIITDINIRFKDIDFMGHVNNAIYITYFEEGRKNFVASVFGLTSPETYSFILAHISCDYVKPVKLNDTVYLEIWVGEIGNKRFDFVYRLLKKGTDDNEPTVCAKGRSVQVFFDYKQNITMAIPEHIREKLTGYIRHYRN
jgi:acyl-CoA thioester hydrolase